MDLLNFLPPEMVEEIFSKLSVDELKTFRLVSKYYEIFARRSLLKLALISIDYPSRLEIFKLDTSNISPFLSSFLIKSPSVKFPTYNSEYTEELFNFFRTKSTGFRHVHIIGFRLEYLENYLGPNLNSLTELKLIVYPYDQTLGIPNVFRFCPNLEKLSIMYIEHLNDDDDDVDDIMFEELKNCLKCAPNLKSFELGISIEEKYLIPLFHLLINHPKLRTISLKICIPGYIMIDIKSYSNFEDIRVEFLAYCDFMNARITELLKCLNNFLKMTSNFIIILNLAFSMKFDFMVYLNGEEVFKEIELPPLVLPLLPKCKQLTIDASSKYKFSSHFLLNSSFPALRKIVTKSSPNVLYCSEIISSVKYLEIWNGSEIETNSWATSFPNTTELIIKNPPHYFLSCLMRDKKIKEMKNLKILNLIDVDSRFFPISSRKYGRGVRLQTLLQSEEGPVKKKLNQLVEESSYSTREINVNENDIGPWSTLFSYFLTIITFNND